MLLVLKCLVYGDDVMDFLKISKKLKAEDVPVYLGKDEEKMQEYLRKRKIEVSYEKIAKDIKLDKEHVMEIVNNISIHWRDNLAPKVFYKSMICNDMKEFKSFFQRADVDLALLCMTMIYDVRKHMKNLGTPAYLLLLDNWKKYRGY